MNKDEVKAQIIESFKSLGVYIVFEDGEDDLDIRTYLTDSLMFVSAIVQLEEDFDIEFEEEQLSWEILSSKPGTDLTQLIITQCRQTRFCLQWTMGLISSGVSVILQLAVALWMSVPVTIMVLVVGSGFLFLFRPFMKKSKS